MTDALCPPLPTPTRARWQPLRLGLVELFHYDSEEFWFRDGHLLLRGNNGTGKSKVLSLTLPFLFDAQLKSSRIEPDGDASKKMAWNLLLGRHDRRMGYAWLELGRVGADGQLHYLTLGCGLLAVAARAQVDNWFFVLEQQRIGRDLWLMSPSRVVLTRERLREALQEHGQVFDTATAYRRAVDERLFHLGLQRYAALMDTLIQLRQPQLSKKPDEANLSNALTEALPPISVELLTDVADALNQLEEYRRELEEYEALERAVGQFNQRYQRYAATQARRRARSLRSAQTGFDNASRDLSDGRLTLETAHTAETGARQAQQRAEEALASHRVRHDELQNDPAMTDAKALDKAAADAERQRSEAHAACTERRHRQTRLEQEQQATRQRAQRADDASRTLTDARTQAREAAQAAGLASDYGTSLLAEGQAAALTPAAVTSAQQDLRNTAAARREQLAHLQRRCDEAEQAARARAHAQDLRDERAAEAEDAATRRQEADTAVEHQGRQLFDAWHSHLDAARQLRVPDSGDVLDALAAWTASLHGDNPARTALHRAQQAASLLLAQRQAALQTERHALGQEQAALQTERIRLQSGEDALPVPPAWRAPDARDGRAGAPLWQLVEFAPTVPADQQAGLEAALQASGMLDAWVTPDGQLQDCGGAPLPHDAQWLGRPARLDSLAAWLRPAASIDATLPVAPVVVQRLLEGVASGEQDDPNAEAWIGPGGRFRLGALAGAWHKPRAEFVGYAARAAARVRRLSEIAQRLLELDQAQSLLQASVAQLAADQHQATSEWQSAPADDALRATHLQASMCVREFDAARLRLDQTEHALRRAIQHWETANQTLEQDARDLALPPEREALHVIGHMLLAFGDRLHALTSAARACHDTLAEQQQQIERERQAQTDAEHAAERAVERELLAEEARIRLQTLRESVGARVEEIQQRIAHARQAVAHADSELRTSNEALRLAGEARARAEQKVETANTILGERIAARQQAIEQWQGFAATGLLEIALPAAELPPQTSAWTIEPALALARRAEQALLQINDDDDAWNRVQNQVSQDYTELGRALAALSHRAQAETSDFGLIVSIVYQNRPERPDQLGTRLAGEIAQRRELLTAGERQVLENHLQAEIASAIHKLLHEAEQQLVAINQELSKRPTSTGVRFRLVWETLPESGDGGAPVGLKAARQRLLNTSTDLWSVEDRRVVGEMLQQRIAAERSRADADQGGSLHEQLARALDYRRWHRFRVQRWDGQWRPLSGPASSGERALGLTVPLFAAVSSYYSQAGHAHAPRLVLLDEVFAGIDDAARHHCWALIREFDLDFVVTSEREWACSAELPGVAIAQLQRHEGIDAVHVSRWMWDGRAKRQEPDPDRRFPPAA
ncbi:TIGR02680 family protein [Xanthomonas cassavae CFBP 4642]|uniref:TIGR02680 family protein n=1 Tax=Xanthomonas cassavae CFBP 4642 TaxID=1219375 RepID=A0ABS8HE69_9XANT|nr:TIGR02680 family protein [Xanthomonas cassavae]MCC4620290.1 TIGR02680 family protein [Xanthomonas cassavae CFBP 4642]